MLEATTVSNSYIQISETGPVNFAYYGDERIQDTDIHTCNLSSR